MIEIVRILLTICVTVSVLRILKKGPDRALALPTPMMMSILLSAQVGTPSPLYMLLPSSAAIWALLYGCYQQKRNLARWATLGGFATALYTQLSATWLASR
jgi:hypothetical protein